MSNFDYRLKTSATFTAWRALNGLLVLFIVGCAPAKYQQAALDIAINTQSVSTNSYSVKEVFQVNPSTLCVLLNITGAGIAPQFNPDPPNKCAHPFPGIGVLSKFVSIGSSAGSAIELSVPVGQKKIDLVGFSKSMFNGGSCPIGSISFVDTANTTQILSNGQVVANMPRGESGDSPKWFASANVAISPGLVSQAVLTVTKSGSDWVGDDYGCGDEGGGNSNGPITRPWLDIDTQDSNRRLLRTSLGSLPFWAQCASDEAKMEVAVFSTADMAATPLYSKLGANASNCTTIDSQRFAEVQNLPSPPTATTFYYSKIKFLTSNNSVKREIIFRMERNSNTPSIVDTDPTTTTNDYLSAGMVGGATPIARFIGATNGLPMLHLLDDGSGHGALWGVAIQKNTAVGSHGFQLAHILKRNHPPALVSASTHRLFEVAYVPDSTDITISLPNLFSVSDFVPRWEQLILSFLYNDSANSYFAPGSPGVSGGMNSLSCGSPPCFDEDQELKSIHSSSHFTAISGSNILNAKKQMYFNLQNNGSSTSDSFWAQWSENIDSTIHTNFGSATGTTITDVQTLLLKNAPHSNRVYMGLTADGVANLAIKKCQSPNTCSSPEARAAVYNFSSTYTPYSYHSYTLFEDQQKAYYVGLRVNSTNNKVESVRSTLDTSSAVLIGSTSKIIVDTPEIHTNNFYPEWNLSSGNINFVRWIEGQNTSNSNYESYLVAGGSRASAGGPTPTEAVIYASWDHGRNWYQIYAANSITHDFGGPNNQTLSYCQVEDAFRTELPRYNNSNPSVVDGRYPSLAIATKCTNADGYWLTNLKIFSGLFR